MGKALWYGGGVQFHDNAGDPLAGGKIYTYEVGTTTPKTAYQDSDLTTPHANPIILDAYGRPPSGQIWFDGDTKALVYDADDVLITPVGGDNLNPDAEGFGSWADKDSGVLTKTAAYTVAVADDGKAIVATSGTWTLTLPAAATAGDGFVLNFLNIGTGVVTMDGDGSETINGSTTLAFGYGEGCDLRCDGVNWHAIINGAMQKMASGTVASAATLDITGLTAAYREIRLVFDGLKPATDNVPFRLRLSDDGGSTYEADAADYAWNYIWATEAGTTGALGDDEAAFIELTGNSGNQAAEEMSGEIILLNPAGTGITQVLFRVSYQSNGPALNVNHGSGQIQAAGPTTAFRVFFSSGNIAAMNYTLYGVRA